MQNRRFRDSWDAIRDFLAVHYRFNRRLDTPFWQHCREHTGLGSAAELVELYQVVGPHQALKTLISSDTLVQFEGYLALLMGQGVTTRCASLFDDEDLKDWGNYQQQIHSQCEQALPVREALGVVNSRDWRWA
jgi:tryptophan halogenase